jgi:transcriptional repressor NrdR
MVCNGHWKSARSVDSVLSRIKHQLQSTGEREIRTRVVGELVMAELRELDEVAYVRFASVYRRFQDLNEFREEIDRLDKHANTSSKNKVN